MADPIYLSQWVRRTDRRSAPDDQAAAPRTAPGGPELAVIVPTFNERPNIEKLIADLDRALTGVAWETVFVDDNSSDGTAHTLRAIAAADRRVRVIRRIGRRGLASAVVEGVLSTSAPVFAVMDADGQHDAATIPRLYAEVRRGADLAIATRNSSGATEPWSSARRRLSALAAWLAKKTLRADVVDPMSGMFAMTRAAFDARADRLSQRGCKILLDILASSPERLRISETSYRFQGRDGSDGKRDARMCVECARLLLSQVWRRSIAVSVFLFRTRLKLRLR